MGAQMQRLMELAEASQKRLAEIAVPGVNARVAQATKFEKGGPVEHPHRRPALPPRVPTFPGYPPERAMTPQIEVDDEAG